MENFYKNSKSPTLVETYDATISASTAITLNTASEIIEVTAIDKGIFLAWNRTVSSSDFDEYIGAGLTRIYVIPEGATTVNFIQQAATAILVCLEK